MTTLKEVGRSKALVAEIAQLQAQLDQVEASLAASETTPAIIDMEVRRMEAEARARIERFTVALSRNPAEGRAALEALLYEPLKFRPVENEQGRRFEISGRISTAALGVSVTSPRGFEPRSPA